MPLRNNIALNRLPKINSSTSLWGPKTYYINCKQLLYSYVSNVSSTLLAMAQKHSIIENNSSSF